MYYILEYCPFAEPDPYRTRCTGWNKDMIDSKFIDGKFITEKFDKPFEFELWEYQGGNGMAEFFYEAFPIMSDKLISALCEAGAENLQTYPAVLRDPLNGYERTDYKVVNVVGKIAAADMSNSDYIDMGGIGMIAVGFKNLVIDNNKTDGALMFRLAESITDIIIHESVKKHLEKCDFKYLRYLKCDM